jgi:hypothetical protein
MDVRYFSVTQGMSQDVVSICNARLDEANSTYKTNLNLLNQAFINYEERVKLMENMNCKR